MIPQAVLELMQCAACGHADLTLGTRHKPELVCEGCGERYPWVDGIFDMVPRSAVQKYRYYRTDTLLDLIAPIYDVIAPLMSVAIWKCPPLRYVDMAHRAIGRADNGVYLECPVGTGLLLGHVRGEYAPGPFIGINSSWRMLRIAQRRFAAQGMADKVTLLRGDPEHLPIRSGVVHSLQSPNGLHAFHERRAVLSEFQRVLVNKGFFSGSTLVRGQGALADLFLNQYERYGVFPMLRGRRFVISELREIMPEASLRHETYGAVFFFQGVTGDAEAP